MEMLDYPHHTGNEMNGIRLGYTKRTGGRSGYPENSFNMALYIGDAPSNVHAHQDVLAEEIGFAPASWIFPIQKHGGNIQEVTHQDAGVNVRQLTDALHDVDGIYTYDRNLLLTMNFADCVPVYMWSRKNDFTALLHAGWRGTSHNITGRMIETYDGEPEDLEIVVGIAINRSCYTVDQKVIDKLKPAGLPDDAFVSHDEGYDLDLKSVNAHQAVSAGADPESVHVTDIGTEDVDRFFSFRLESEETGRALAFIGRKENDQR